MVKKVVPVAEPSKKEKVVRNVLNRKDERTLEDFILGHKEEIEQGKWTQPTLANSASHRMGRPITAANVHGACRALGIEFPRAAGPKALNSIRRLRVGLKIVANELRLLLASMGSVASPSVLALCEALESDEEEVDNANGQE
jgi:hypothetical protein